MRRLATLRVSSTSLVLLFGLAAAGCSSTTGLSEPTTWTLRVPLTGLRVIGDCEATIGNPGEFAWRVEIGNGTSGLMDVRETDGFPSASGAWELSEITGEYALPYGLRLTGVPSDARSQLSITVTAVEWDGAERDAAMTFERASEPIRTGLAGTGAIAVGPSNDCRLVFGYAWDWTEG